MFKFKVIQFDVKKTHVQVILLCFLWCRVLTLNGESPKYQCRQKIRKLLETLPYQNLSFQTGQTPWKLLVDPKIEYRQLPIFRAIWETEMKSLLRVKKKVRFLTSRNIFSALSGFHWRARSHRSKKWSSCSGLKTSDTDRRNWNDREKKYEWKRKD